MFAGAKFFTISLRFIGRAVDVRISWRSGVGTALRVLVRWRRRGREGLAGYAMLGERFASEKRACKPGSVLEDGHLSRGAVADVLEQATRMRAGPAHGIPICLCFGWGLSSRRVAVALVRSYRTVSAFLRVAAGSLLFCDTDPSGRPARPLAGIPPCEARTFLIALEALRDRPARFPRRRIIAQNAPRAVCAP